MVKTPEEYFAAQCFEVQPASSTTLSAAEHAFVQKYLGSDALKDLPEQAPEQVLPGLGGATSTHAPLTLQDHDEHAATPVVNLRTRLAMEDRVQMVSFYVRNQIFLLPVSVILEVLRYVPLTRLPMAPPFVAGVVNLRGRVTPLLHLDSLLTLEEHFRYTPQSFIIVCGTSDMQFGLIIDKVHTMYIVEKSSITWNVEAHIGLGAEFLCGLANISEHLHGIVDPEMIVDKLIEV
jgi:purine-binding chemotaxis protein CheW